MLYRGKHLAGVSKQTVRIVSISGQTTVPQGQKIIVTLPPNALVDLSTFEMNYTGQTQHGGNGVVWVPLEEQRQISEIIVVNVIFLEILHQ
jgi:hypothetical protein